MRRHSLAITLVTVAALACAPSPREADRADQMTREDDRPELLIVDLTGRPDSAQLMLPGRYFDTDEEAQPDTLPPLPYGMTLAMIVDGDRLFHGRGGCASCHGSEAQGLPARGKTLTANLHFIPVGAWEAIDSLISVGMPDRLTRTHIAMPPRGKEENLRADEVHAIGAYVWAISQVKGEPWPAGHPLHAPHDWRASARTSIP